MVEWQLQYLEDAIWEGGMVKLLLGEVYDADRTTWSVRGWLQG